ncbi:MAG: MBL fold metallo-hydrolase [Promethearchaeota archaeon]
MVSNELVEVTDQLFLLPGNNDGRFPYSHSILILDEEIVLIDTGCGIEILKELKKRFEISHVINSHTHPDHSAGNWVFQGRPICVPEEGFDSSGDIVALSKRFANEELAETWQHFVKKALGFQDCQPTGTYTEGQPLTFGETSLKVIHTPGHTVDHYCFYEKEQGVLLSFDYDLTSFPWYGHRESSLSEFRASIKRLKALSPRIVVSSHRGIIAENIDAEFDRFSKIIDERNVKLLKLLEEGKTIEGIVDMAPIYGKFPYAETLLRYWETQMIRQHLEELEKDGKVHQQGDYFIRNKK